MGKFDFSEVISDVRASLKKDKRTEDVEKVASASGMNPVSRDPKDYVVMPNWWLESYGVHGLPFGKVVQAAGDSDTGKTSLCITAMKAAQEQGYGIIYVETEGKTSEDDLADWGVDPAGVMFIGTNITEKAFDLLFRNLEAFFAKFPKEKVLVVIDSFGNTISMYDKDLDIIEKNQKPGGAGKTNRFGLGRLISMMDEMPIAILLITYEYDNIGTVGKKQAGGKALKFYTMIGISTASTGAWTKVKDGQKVKVGTYVKWTTFKNHYAKAAIDEEGNRRLLPTEVLLQISAKGIERNAKPPKESGGVI